MNLAPLRAGAAGRVSPIVIDAVVAAVAYLLAFILRFDSVRAIPAQHIAQFWLFWAMIPAARLCCNAVWGLYRQVWRYVGMRDAVAIAMATLTGSAIFSLLVLMSGQLGFPRSVIGIEFLLALVLSLGVRVLWRTWIERGPRWAEGATRTLVVGAGDAGELLVRDMVRRPDRGMLPVGFIDDSLPKQGRRIHGVEVIGRTQDIPRLVADRGIDLVVVAIPGAPLGDRRSILKLAAATAAQVKTLPGLHEILGGSVTVQEIRDVAIEDLLGRDQIVMDAALVSYLRGKRILVSGAGGSIGAELCRQIARLEPECLICLGHGENSVYSIDHELRNRFPTMRMVTTVADIRDVARIGKVFVDSQPEIVFHAAAHKHVPLMEHNEIECVSNNVFGTLAVAQAASEWGVLRFVLVSTDKAVNPTSVMGKTKRLAELLIQDLAARSKTRYVAVRFGNVLGSRGSVVPLFKKQISDGGPVTVTHPDMRRYFMTIPEAVTLVIQAGFVGRQGEVLLLDMGDPVRIVDLARNLIKLSGYRPLDIEIVFTGPRPGEKLFEELLVTDEEARPTEHPQIFAARRAAPPDPTWWAVFLSQLREAAQSVNPQSIRDLLNRAMEADQPRLPVE